MKRLLLVAVAIVASSCSGNSSTAPTATSTPTPTPTPSATTFALTGAVTESAPTTATRITGATITIADGPNAGRTAITDSAGAFLFSGLQQSGFTVNAAAPGYAPTSRSVTLTSNQTIAFGLFPNARSMSETFTGTISGGDAACSGGDGTYRDKPCKVITIPVHNAGAIDATLTWSPGSVADLDLSLFSQGSTSAIARSTSATGASEHVSSNLSGGSTYELHVTYYGGSNITNYTVTVTHMN